MIWSIPALQDTTIYQSDPYRNTGLDQILELHKAGDVTTSDLTESRILIKFDLTTLTGILSENSIDINSISASLKLYTVQESELPKSYTIEARPLSVDWAPGSGYQTTPVGIIASTAITDGATWVSTAGLDTATWSGSLAANSQISYYSGSDAGGGVWFTGSVASQSFSYNTNDPVSIDITSIVKNWYNSVYTNNGLVVSYNLASITASNYPETLLQFYSSNTHTVYEPQLYISWTGSITYNTGSMELLTYDDDPVLYTRNFKGEYLANKKVRVLLGSRARYPRPTFAQNTEFATMKALPQNSYYQIKDAHSDEIVIPYSNETKISTNANGSYFDFYTTMMYPERYYKFEVKTVFDDITEYFDSVDFTFKVIR